MSGEGRPELGVGGQARLVAAGQDERHPAAALLLGQGEPEVLAHHVPVAAVALGVLGRPAEDLGQPRRDVARVVLGQVREHLRQDVVLAHAPVEDLGQPVERGPAAGPVVEGGRRRHGVLLVGA